MSQCDYKIDFWGSFVSKDPEQDFEAFEECLKKSAESLNDIYKLGPSQRGHWNALQISKFAHGKTKEPTFFK
jgi:hypothetical protein